MLISPLSIAPMIDWTYSQFRMFMRILVPKALLYTEMQTAQAVMHNGERALAYQAMEQPLAIQLGGSDANMLAECARIAEQAGFAEINYNLGCPSDRVQAGRFGACLMGEPSLAVKCFEAMKKAVDIPVTAKTRIGIDSEDSYAFFSAFAERLINAGCDKLIVHARKAWLNGLNPKQNRTIPPLHYEYVYRIKQQYPELPVVINGHINTLEETLTHMQHVDGIMSGRLACQNPYALTQLHHYFYPECKPISRAQAMREYMHIIAPQMTQQVPLSILLKPVMALAHGVSGAKRWKGLLMNTLQSRETHWLDEACEWLTQAEL